MINRLKYATIADIGIYDLVFYDESKVEKNIQFAKDNGITYLPAKNRKEVYKLVDDNFVKTSLGETLKINPFDLVFDKNTLEKFRQVNHNEIRFIVENDLIKGVVHIVDYNNEFLQVQLYRALFLFESNLRKLLVLDGKTNDDFIEWMKNRFAKEKDENSKKHWQERLSSIIPEDDARLQKVLEERKDLGQFQSFYLREILRFAGDLKLIDKSIYKISNISDLRNQVAHSGDFTTSDIDSDGNLIFNFNRLSKFINDISEFFVAYDDLLLKVKENNKN